MAARDPRAPARTLRARLSLLAPEMRTPTDDSLVRLCVVHGLRQHTGRPQDRGISRSRMLQINGKSWRCRWQHERSSTRSAPPTSCTSATVLAGSPIRRRARRASRGARGSRCRTRHARRVCG
eukprot:413963-Lingulodinium_polyedra.AAC.1